VFSTPDNTFNVPSVAGTPIQQQYQNLFSRSFQQNVSTPEFQHNQHQNHNFTQPQVPVNNFNYVPGNLNHVFNSIPSMNHHLNNLQANSSGISIAPVAKVPTFSPVSNQHSSNFNSFNMFKSSSCCFGVFMSSIICKSTYSLFSFSRHLIYRIESC
jgi:hypothetical protein